MPDRAQPRWSHYQPVRIYNGRLQDTVLSALQVLQSTETGCVLLVTSAGFTRRGVCAQIESWLAPRPVWVIDEIKANPNLDSLDEWIRQYAKKPITAVIGLGGGSAMDAAKALALMLPVTQELTDPLAQVLREKTLVQPMSRLPLILIPTTAGTGSEVTPFATIWDYRHKQKYSLSGQHMAPDVALLDANLTLSLPAEETLFSGLDALSHSLESLWNRHRTPISEAYARQAVELLSEHFVCVLLAPSNVAARKAMQTASLLAGLAISTTRTAVAHAISYPLTSHYAVPHGLACSFTLPALLELMQKKNTLPHLTTTWQQAASLLQKLPLQQMLYRNIDFTRIYDHTDEMFHPDRAGNFVLSFDAKRLMEVLQRSESLLKAATPPAKLVTVLS